eukprot:2375910-Prymnesium_polylepis.1
MLCTCSPRGSPVSQEAESARQREKSTCDTQRFNVHTPASTLRTRVSIKNVPWGSDRAGGGQRARAHVL